jgi:hypothetical protein
MRCVGWDGEHDPMNPRNWALWRKSVVVAIVSAITFFSPLASSMFAPGIPSVMKDFNTTNKSLGTLCVSVYILVCLPPSYNPPPKPSVTLSHVFGLTHAARYSCF